VHTSEIGRQWENVSRELIFEILQNNFKCGSNLWIWNGREKRRLEVAEMITVVGLTR
jgi:hypothetical protein